MGAAYDNFDYPSYWLSREYEHKSEIHALREFISKIHKVKTILEVGAGFGRLVNTYLYRGKKIILTDPSAKLLKIAKNSLTSKKCVYIHTSLEKLSHKIRPKSVDLIIFVRVIHHISNISLAFKIINRALVPGGYFILEYPNKRHFKAVIKELFKGNLTYSLNIFTTDLRSHKSILKNTLPFYNYHPDTIEQSLRNNGFKIIERKSVSNLRSSWIKKVIAIDTLLFFEKKLQNVFSYLNFGPSIFILAKKI